jgi:glutamate racemase
MRALPDFPGAAIVDSMINAGHRLLTGALLLCAALPAGRGEDIVGPVAARALQHTDGGAAWSVSLEALRRPPAEMAALPIGVFDSGIGGLTVLEEILRIDAFHNDTLQPGPDGRPDFENERFIYFGDQANMPYGNYAAADRSGYLRELILKDALFLLGNRYWVPGEDAPRTGKPPVKALVIACNTATAYGLEDVRELMSRLDLPVFVVGVVEAGARGLLSAPEAGAVGILATVGTCASGAYPRAIESTRGLAGRGAAEVAQQGSPSLAGIIEGDPAFTVSLEVQAATDALELVRAHQSSGGTQPLTKIVLGCTHFPLIANRIDAAFRDLRRQPGMDRWIAQELVYVNPAEWTARELFMELARARLRHSGDGSTRAMDKDKFFLSVPAPNLSADKLAEGGSLAHDYKYGRSPGNLDLEDTRVTPMTVEMLPESSRNLVKNRLPLTWERLQAN